MSTGKRQLTTTEPPLSKKPRSDGLNLEKNNSIIPTTNSDMFIPRLQLKKGQSINNFQTTLTWIRNAPIPADRSQAKKKMPIYIVGSTGHLIAHVMVLSFLFP